MARYLKSLHVNLSVRKYLTANVLNNASLKTWREKLLLHKKSGKSGNFCLA